MLTGESNRPNGRHRAPRCPAQRALYQIAHDHFETFRAQAASLRDGEGLPRFVEQEFRDFLPCGWLAGGFARFRCGLERLVPFRPRHRFKRDCLSDLTSEHTLWNVCTCAARDI